MESKNAFTPFMEVSPSRAVSPTSTVFRPRSPFRSGGSSPGSASTSRPAKDQFGSDVLSEPSCVTRGTFPEDCARDRFIAWAAVKRNSCARMKPEEKLRCPLLRCKQRFPNHELMLLHLAGCELLAFGEYWCYDHMRIERFDDVKCKRCLGHPSKRRRVLSMAKGFFHSLGHRSRRGQALDSYAEDASMPPPPSYDSISSTPHLADLTELPATQIVEADSTEIRTLPSDAMTNVTAIDPKALLVPSVPERLSIGQPSPHFIQWDQTRTLHDSNIPLHAPDDIEMFNASNRPSLQLNTIGLQGSRHPVPPKQVLPSSRSKNLSPSSSLRSNTSTNSTLSTATSLISPVSNWSGAWSLGSGFNTGMTSPVDDIPADNPFASSSINCNDMSGIGLHNFYSELPADVPETKGAGDSASDPLLLFIDGTPSLNPPYAGDITFGEDQLVHLGDSSIANLDVCCSDAKSMVGSACDALQAHMDESTVKIRHAAGNQLAEQLRAMSTKAVAAAGLRTLRALLSGNSPPSAIDALCFIHLTYAFSMVTFEQHTEELSTNLFIQSLSYGTEFPPIDKNVYHQLVSLIWQPPHIRPESDATSLSRSLVALGKRPEATLGPAVNLGADTLLSVALSFLDRLEISLVLGKPPTSPKELASELYAKHVIEDINLDIMKTPFPIAASIGIQELQRGYADNAGLAENLIRVVRRIQGGMLFSVRRLEIELLQAGMDCLDPLQCYESFIPDVKKLCDEMYEHHNYSTSRRIVYHNHAVSLIESLMSLPTREADNINKYLDQLASSYGNRQPSDTSELDPWAEMTFDDFVADLSGIPDIENQNMRIPTVVTVAPDNFASGLLSAPSEVIPKLEQPRVEQQQQQQKREEEEEEAQRQKLVEAYACCDECGYKPKGDPQWFKGSMAKHKKLMHSTEPPRIYKCPFPGCTSQYKNRLDNLRQHQYEKGHFVEGEAIAPRRPSKRKKTAAEDE